MPSPPHDPRYPDDYRIRMRKFGRAPKSGPDHRPVIAYRTPYRSRIHYTLEIWKARVTNFKLYNDVEVRGRFPSWTAAAQAMRLEFQVQELGWIELMVAEAILDAKAKTRGDRERWGISLPDGRSLVIVEQYGQLPRPKGPPDPNAKPKKPKSQPLSIREL